MSVLKGDSKALPLPQRNLEALTTTVLPALRKLIEWKYFSLSVDGVEHVPRSGPFILAANHAGWLTIDTFFGALITEDYLGIERLPWPAGQDFMFKLPKLGKFFADSGVFPASWLRTPEALPPEMEIFCVYPEGAEGSCKSLVHAYNMKEWKTGFLRLALARKAPIVPVAIVGGEEAFPSLLPIRSLKSIAGTILPLPVSFMPLPSRWKFVFHEPVDVCKALNEGGDFETSDIEVQKSRLRTLAADIRNHVQATLDRETADYPLARISRRIRNPLGK